MSALPYRQGRDGVGVEEEKRIVHTSGKTVLRSDEIFVPAFFFFKGCIVVYLSSQ